MEMIAYWYGSYMYVIQKESVKLYESLYMHVVEQSWPIKHGKTLFI